VPRYSVGAQVLVLAPPLPGAGERVRAPWTNWSGPSFALGDERLDHPTDVYSPPGAFAASIAWYRAPEQTFASSPREKTPDREKRTAAPTTVLWPEHDPLFDRAWSDRLDDYFSDVELELLDGVGHFTPLEAPDAFAAAIARRLGGAG